LRSEVDCGEVRGPRLPSIQTTTGTGSPPVEQLKETVCPSGTITLYGSMNANGNPGGNKITMSLSDG